MPISNYPQGFSHGVAIRGLPVLNAYGGNVYWVDSGPGSDANDGTHNRPWATLDYAVGRCTANNGDIIMVKAGHSETLIADSGVDVDVAGVTIVGLGVGADRPTFDFTTDTDADFKLAAANVVIHNLLFTSGIASQAMMVETSGDDFEISHCEFRNNSSTQALIGVNIGVGSNDSDRGYVHNCRFVSGTANATSAISVTALQAGLRIENNYVRGDYSDAAVQSAVIHTDCVVKGNYLQNDNNTAHAVQFSTTSTGIIRDNVMVTDAIATALDQGSCFASGNMYYDDGDTDTAATPIPTTAGTGAVGEVTLGGVNDTTTDSLHGKIGTDTEMSDVSLFDMFAVPSQDATTDVNVRDVVGKKDDTASPVPATTDSLVSYVKGILGSGLRTLTKTDGAVLTGDDPLFTIAGGSIHVVEIKGLVTTVIGGASNMHLNCAVTTPSADVSMSTDVAIGSDGEGATYHFLGDNGVLTPVDAGLVFLPYDEYAGATNLPTQWIVPIGTIEASGSAAQTGVIQWTMTYWNHSGATVTVAV